MNDKWSWDYVGEILPELLRGLLVTFEATALGAVLAYLLGLVLALLRRSGVPVLSQLTWAFIEFIRSTPLLVHIYFVFNVLPQFGITLSPLTSGVVAIGVHYACYTAEVYRAGIEGVPSGQWEACTALSLPRGRTWAGVILPQAVPRVLPALGNYTISMYKEVPLMFAIGVLDIVGRAKEVASESFRAVEPYTIAGVFFLLLSYPAGVLVRRLERRIGYAQ